MKNREQFKKFYKDKMKEDRMVGIEINRLMQILQDQYHLEESARTPELIKVTLEKMTELRQQRRFRDDFPSFAKFKEFVELEKVSLEDLDRAKS